MNWYQYILELYGTNWLASNILLLASKKCFLSSQGPVGAGMGTLKDGHIRRVWRYQRGNQNPYIEEKHKLLLNSGGH